MKYVCIALLKLYKATISKIKPKTCRFQLSCSVYSMESYYYHGFFKGTWLTIKRLFRCNPWSKGGFDPTPYDYKGVIKWSI